MTYRYLGSGTDEVNVLTDDSPIFQIADENTYVAKADGTNVSTDIQRRKGEYEVYMFVEPTPRPEYAYSSRAVVQLSVMVASNDQAHQSQFNGISVFLQQRSYPEQGVITPFQEKYTWHAITPPYAFVYSAMYRAGKDEWLERDWNNLVPTLVMKIKSGSLGWTMRVVVVMLALVEGAKPKPGGRKLGVGFGRSVSLESVISCKARDVPLGEAGLV